MPRDFACILALVITGFLILLFRWRKKRDGR